MELHRSGLTLVEASDGVNSLPFVQALLCSSEKTAPTVCILSDPCTRSQRWAFLNKRNIVDICDTVILDSAQVSNVPRCIRDALSALEADSVIVLDCFESLLMLFGIAETLRLLDDLLNSFNRFSWLMAFNSTYITDDFREQLQRTAKKCFRLASSCVNTAGCAVELQNGRSKYIWDFSIGSNRAIQLAKRRLAATRRDQMASAVNESSVLDQSRMTYENVISGVKFNLKLSRDELEAKQKLQLPYKDPVNAAPKSIKIHYLAEPDDDVDDEDPDDDLDL